MDNISKWVRKNESNTWRVKMARLKQLHYLRYIEKMSIEDISREMGIEERTLRKFFYKYEKENKNE